MYLFDTDVVIDVLRGKTPLFLYKTLHPPFFISAITLCEIQYGFARRAGQCSLQKKRFKLLLQSSRALPFFEEVAPTFAEAKFELFKKNKIIGASDLLIASQALHDDLTVVTRNKKDFGRLQALKILDLSLEERVFL